MEILGFCPGEEGLGHLDGFWQDGSHCLLSEDRDEVLPPSFLLTFPGDERQRPEDRRPVFVEGEFDQVSQQRMREDLKVAAVFFHQVPGKVQSLMQYLPDQS